MSCHTVFTGDAAAPVEHVREIETISKRALIPGSAVAVIHTAGAAGIGIADAFHMLAAFDFSRSGTRLHGTLVDPPLTTGGAPKARTGRDAWEDASLKLAEFIHEQATAAA